MTTKKELAEFLSDYFCHTGINLDKVADEIIELFTRSNIKENLYKKALKRELKDKYEEDKYGIHCIACGAYNPIAKKIFHYRRCPTQQLERILAL